MTTERRSRKRILIDRRFQGKWTLILTLAGTLSAALFASALWYSIDRQNALLSESIGTDQQLRKQSQDVMILLLNMPDRSTAEKANYKKQFNAIAAKHERGELHKKQLIHRNNLSRYLLVLFVIGIGVFLFIWGIYLTHKIAGPLLVIRRHMERLRDGQPPDLRPIRKEDEFQDLYRVICEALKSLP